MLIKISNMHYVTSVHHVIIDTPLNRCSGHFVDPEEFTVNDGWFVPVLTEIDCSGHGRYESGLHGYDIVQVVLKL